MAPTPITHDYYGVLEVEQTAERQTIVSSYRRLALRHHPDRNHKQDTTAAFQLLGQAYETLSDASNRQAYDLIYPSMVKNPRASHSTQTPGSTPAANTNSKSQSKEAEIAALQRVKQERNYSWQMRRITVDEQLCKLRRDISKLKQEIENLTSIQAAEAASDAEKNSWLTWLMSPIYKVREDDEDEKERKDRARQERRIEKDMKERRLASKEADLIKHEELSRKSSQEKYAADSADQLKIDVLQNKMWMRRDLERQKKEAAERDQRARVWKEQAEQQRRQQQEAAAKLRKQQAEPQAAEQKRREKEHEKMLTCDHDGWWPKVQGHTTCPECDELWSYLLQCPRCVKKACPKCQYQIRPRRQHGGRRRW